MTDHDDIRSNLFSDWLDTGMAGTSTPAAEPDADLADLRAATAQFHGLDRRLTEYAVAVSPRSGSWEDVMALRASVAPAGSTWLNAPARSARPPSRSTAWARAASVFLAAVVVMALAAGAWRASDNFGSGDEQPGGSIPFGGAVPDATPADDNPEVSYLPPEACTVEPLSRDEVIAHLEQATIATAEDLPRFDQPQVPAPAQASGIMETFGMWDACSKRGGPIASALRFQSPWFTREFMIAGSGYDMASIDDATIGFIADLALATTEAERQTIRDDHPDLMPPLATGVSTPDIPAGNEGEQAESSPDANSYGWYPTIVGDQVELTGPETASAPLRLYDPVSGSIYPGPAFSRVDFVLVDGVWLLDAYGPWVAE